MNGTKRSNNKKQKNNKFFLNFRNKKLLLKEIKKL